MIKEKDLAPGRVITRIDRRWTSSGEVVTVAAWMVIGFQEQVRRRHGRSTAPRDGYHVLMLSLGGDGDPLREFTITPRSMQGEWKRLF